MRRAASSVLVVMGLFAASVAWWAFAARFTVLDSGRSVFWAIFGWGLPYVMTKIDEPRLAALGAIGVAAVGPMIAPAVLLVSAGIGAILGARAWRGGPAPPP